jgi:hypothetical protein
VQEAQKEGDIKNQGGKKSMKTTLEFNEEEKERALCAIQGMKLYFILHGLDDTLRKYLKYGHDFKNIEDCMEHLREKIRDDMSDYGMSL